MEEETDPIEADNYIEDMLREVSEFEPTPLSLEYVETIVAQEDLIKRTTREGTFGMQVLSMHPTGHVQMGHDLVELAKFYLQHHYGME